MYKFKSVLASSLFAMLLVGCANLTGTSEKAPDIHSHPREYSVQSILWQQNAAEYKALTHQAFNLAKMRLAQITALPEHQGKKLALITDIDETVLDNSPYNAMLIHKNLEYTHENWKSWTDLAEAKPVPGAKEFLDYAKNIGVSVFYVSNRRIDEKETTLKNLKAVDFPFAEEANLLLRTDTGSKNTRFEKVMSEYTVVMFVGDNLGDFSSDFDVASQEKRDDLVEELKERFGVDFIVLPNPMYGTWETHAIYGDKYHWTPAQKDSIHKSRIYGF